MNTTCGTNAVYHSRSNGQTERFVQTFECGGEQLNKEFKKLRRQLQGKRHIKIEVWVKLSLLRLFHVDHVLQNRRSALSFAWYEWFSCKGKE